MHPPCRNAKRLAIAGVSLLLSALAAELGFRAWSRWNGHPCDAAGTERYGRQAVDRGALRGSVLQRGSTRDAYELLRRRGAELRALGVAFHDATRVFEDLEATAYTDPVHFNGDAMRLFEAEVSASFCASLAEDLQDSRSDGR